MPNLRNSLTHAYLKDLDIEQVGENDILRFGYIPEEISDSKSANYTLIDIPGRSEPVVAYMNSSPREFSLHLMFMAGINQDKHATDSYNSTAEDNAQMVKQKTNWLRSLVYPDYSAAGIVKPPHRVLLSIGSLIKSVCIAMSVNVVYKAPWDESLYSYLAEVDISLQEINKVPSGYSTVRSGGYELYL